MRKLIILILAFIIVTFLPSCKKVVQKIPIDACTIPAHTEQEVWYTGTGDDKKMEFYTVKVPTTYMICFRVVYDDDSSLVRWEEVMKDEYDVFLEEASNER